MMESNTPAVALMLALGLYWTVNQFQCALGACGLDASQSYPLLREAESLGWLHINRTSVRWDTAHYSRLTRDLAFEPLVATIAHYIKHHHDDRQTLALWAFYRNQPELFESGYSAPDSLSDEFLADLHPALQSVYLDQFGLKWLDQEELTPVRRRLLHLHPTLAFDLGLLEGKLPYDKAPERMAVRRLLQGQSAEAHSSFQAILARKKCAPGWTGMTVMMAQLAALRQSDLHAVMDERFFEGSFCQITDFLRALAQHLMGVADEWDCGFPRLEGRVGLALHAAVEPLLPDYIPRLTTEERMQASESWSSQGLPGLVRQLLAPQGPEHWAWGLGGRETWENWLESLRWQGERSLQTLSRVRTETWRLAWSLDGRTVTPLKQKAVRNGWSGQNASYWNLHCKSPAYLSEQDRIFMSKIREVGNHHAEPDGEGWGALVGHPHLYMDGEPATLEELPLRLEVRAGPEGLEIVVEPREFLDGQEFALVRLGSGKLGLCRPSPQQKQLFALLGQRQTIPVQGGERLVDSLRPWIDRFELKLPPDLVPARQAGSQLVCRVRPLEDGLTFDLGAQPVGPKGPFLAAGQGPQQLLFREARSSRLVTRDLGAERAALAELCPHVLPQNPMSAPEPANALEMLLVLQQAGVPLYWPAGKAWSIAGVQNNLRLQAEGDGNWFEVRGQVVLENGLKLEIQQLLTLTRASRGRFVKLAGERFVALSEELHQRLQALDQLVEVQHRKVLLNRLAAPALAELGAEGDERFQACLRTMQEAEEYQALLPVVLHADLRDYQAEGFRWMARRARAGAGCCLADDMGLGKTLQVLALLAQESAQGAQLVVCPTSVLNNWLQQAARFAPSLKMLVLEGRERHSQLERLGPGMVALCSYAILLRDGEILREVDWRTVILDEAQYIKNPESKTAQTACSLRATVRVATTGTPVENRLTELWSLFRFLNPGLLGSLGSFQKRFVERPEARLRLRRLVAPFLLRRLKSEVLKELPPRTDINLEVELSERERAVYETLREQAVLSSDPLQLLAQLMRLRQACCHPSLVGIEGQSSKLEAFMQLAGELRAGRHRVLVFSQFVELLRLLRERLEQEGWDYLYLDGSTPSAQRPALVDEFQRGDTDFFLISLKAGGTGLNLTAADYVVHLDPWWNPAVEDQASDRAHRLGQTRPVTVYRLVAKNTLEERVLQLHSQKRELARNVLDNTEAESRLDADELRALLAS